MIVTKNLQKAFGDHMVLKGIDQHIEKGEKVVVIGPSGSGKSTFLRCLNLLEQPTGGEIIFEGTTITDPSCNINELRQRMGMVFQQFNLFPHKTVAPEHYAGAGAPRKDDAGAGRSESAGTAGACRSPR